MLTAYFYHKTTGLPLTDTGVTVYCKLADMNSDTLLLNNEVMSPSASFEGAFRYSYTINQEIDYMVYYSCSDSNYIAQVDKIYISATRGGGGGASININGIQTTIRNSTKALSEEFDKKLLDAIEQIRVEFNDTNSHIDIANSGVIDTIKAIPDTDLSKVTESLGTLKMTLTKLSQFVRSEAEKEKNEEKKKMSEEYESKLSELVDKIEKMEDAYEELDLSIGDKEKLIEDMEKTAQEVISELEKEKQDAKSLAKQDIISSLSE